MLFFGLLDALVGKPGVHPRHIIVIEALRWSWSHARRTALIGLGGGLVYGLLTGLLSGLSGHLGGLFYGQPGGQLGRLLGGLTSGEVQEKNCPNQGIRRSAQRALLTGLGVGLGIGLFNGLFYGLRAGLVAELVYGPLFGLPSALAYGGYACLSHVALRLILWHCGAMPLRYIRFLDDSADRILLRRVGGGYSFIHRLLLDWFAKQYTGPETQSAPTAPSAPTQPRR